jgi:hypothetical protein
MLVTLHKTTFWPGWRLSTRKGSTETRPRMVLTSAGLNKTRLNAGTVCLAPQLILLMGGRMQAIRGGETTHAALGESQPPLSHSPLQYNTAHYSNACGRVRAGWEWKGWWEAVLVATIESCGL